LTLARRLSGQETFNTDIFVEILPMNPVALPNESPLISFVQSGMEESGEPREGN
jgi:hypothetical protein